MTEQGAFEVSGHVLIRSESTVGDFEAWGGAWVQVIDLDRFRHDLIAEGPTLADGSFCVLFTIPEFNLDLFEHEEWPELWITVSRRTSDGDLVAMESVGIPRSAWTGTTAVLDDVLVDRWMFALPETEHVPVPGRHRRRVEQILDQSPLLVSHIAWVSLRRHSPSSLSARHNRADSHFPDTH